ncbi:MAG TPA: PDZ domain-containing protein [Gemmatimonadales bacterium]|nr:PDZ domain-containing protein [Gemmatimonadales bacterium]
MLLALLLSLAPPDTVRYTVSFPNAAHHEARIVAEFPAHGRDTLEVWMSRSSPGRYALHEFAKNVYDVSATDARGRPLAVVRRDPYRWLVVSRRAPVRFSYTLFADRGDGTYSQVDRTHAHLNVPATFAWARGLEARPVLVRFRPPGGSRWRVATQLLPAGDSLAWAAPDLAYFMDSPMELSDFRLRTWTVPGPAGRVDTIRLAVHHLGTEAELDAFAEAARKVVAEQVAIYGETARYDHGTYTFLADYLPWASGDGMEHRNSTVVSSTGALGPDGDRLLRTVSHEFFHSWNMERIRSAEIEPFDFTSADPSHGLWFGEGFTQYYDKLAIRRAGLMSDSAYAASAADVVNAVRQAPGRRFFSPMEMSLQAPFTDAATSIDPTNQVNTFLSYYTGGAAVALGLDLTLRARFEGKSLDGFMQLMWERFGRPVRRYAVRRTYTVADLERTLGEYAGDGAFAREFFARYVRGKDVPDYAALLARAGMVVRPARAGTSWTGPLVLAADSAAVVVQSPTLAGTPAYQAGLDAGDRLVAAGGRPVRTVGDWDSVVAAHAPGDELPIVFVQRGLETEATLRLAEDPTVEIVPAEVTGPPPGEAEGRFRAAWLGSRADGAPAAAAR